MSSSLDHERFGLNLGLSSLTRERAERELTREVADRDRAIRIGAERAHLASSTVCVRVADHRARAVVIALVVRG